jgi:hypothetical membrane protein
VNLKEMTDRRNLGTVLLVGCLLQFFGMQIAEYVYPGYSVSQNYISDLGVDVLASALLFNVTLFIFGACVVFVFYKMRQQGMDNLLCLLLILAGVGAILVSIFNEHTIGAIHYTGAVMAFCLTAVAAIRSNMTIFKGTKLGKVCVALGIVGLAAAIGKVALVNVNDYLGIGKGGMERMMYYPAILFALIIAVYLLLSAEKPAPEE